MKSRKTISAVVFAVSIVFNISSFVAAQDASAPHTNTKHHHYQFIDLGTFGGTASYLQNGFDGILNNQGTSVGWADTSTPDPYPAFCFQPPGCFVTHAFSSKNGVVTDLGALPGGSSSAAFWITTNGLIGGNSQNGELDPLNPGAPENRAVLWNDGQIIDLGTLGGGHESFMSGVNSRGQAVGFSTTTEPDPFLGIQVRAFLWQNGAMQDLGTLGGPDAIASLINESGQVAGYSFTNSTPNPVLDNCGINVPTQDPFIWDKGKMTDLGTLGGTCGFVSGQNNRGQVIGQSDLVGDLTFHPYIWSKNGGMRDLGTLGGDTGEVNWISDAGDIAGKADLPGPAPQNHDSVLWKKNGAQTIDLGVLPGDSCANAYYVNSPGQVVGTSENNDLCRIPTGEHAFLWEKSGPMVDLNALIPPGSSLELTFAFAINNRGEIVGVGVPSGCTPENVGLCGHAFVLTPCDGNHPNLEGCDYSMVDASVTQSNNSAARPLAVTPQIPTSPKSTVNQIRNRWMQHLRLPAQRTAPQG